jgi:hypothetical protein
MATRYENLLNELKTELGIRNIGYNKIIKLINRQKYDEIRVIVNDYVINNIIDGIITERELIGNMMANILNSLVMLNDLLIIFDEEPQPSLTKARKSLKKKVFINIYDLVAMRYEMRRKTKRLLIEYVRGNPDRRFPLNDAKRNCVLKSFLHRIF